jgi:hydrogenase expression/formation protein HypC
MCLVLPARVLGVEGQSAEVELYGGMRATASLILRPNAAVGDYVIVDRGMVLEVIEPAEAEALLAMYAEIGDLLAAEEDAMLPDWTRPSEPPTPATVGEAERA